MRAGTDGPAQGRRDVALRAAAVLALGLLGASGAAPAGTSSDDPYGLANAAWWRRIGFDLARVSEPAAAALALVDTAVDLEHEDLASIPARESYRAHALAGGSACTSAACCEAAETAVPGRFHGTAVAGLIAATRDNGRGVAGVANVTRLVAVDIYGPNADPGPRIAAGIECAVARGARVVNVSVQGHADSDEARLDAALSRAEQAGALVVLAAGNGIGDLDRDPEWPAALHSRASVTVTAVDLEDRLTGQRFGLKSVDLAAPATERMVCTSFPGAGVADGAIDETCASTATGHYGRFGQSSAAAAMVSGAALLLWGHPNYRDCTAEQVRALLLKHARTPDDASTRAVLSPFGGVLDVRFLADVVQRGGRVVDLCSGALR
jgi:subtilisin family serine protease